MALTKVINDLADLNQSGSTNALKGCAGTTAQQPASSSSIDYVIVGGGGAGGIGSGGGGGGAGGYLTGSTTVYHGTPTVLTIGEGGLGSSSTSNPYTSGDDSGFNGIRAIGGGLGGVESTGLSNGVTGGSGGGGCYYQGGVAGSGTTLQGNAGGIGGSGNPDYTGGGGGGSGNPAQDTNGIGQAGGSSAGGPGTGTGGDGGSGTDITSFISVANANLAQIGDTSNTTQVFIAGGGGGGSQNGSGSGIAGTGGAGGSGKGIYYTQPSLVTSGTNNNNGEVNTGGGGGGGSNTLSSNGGSGVAVLKYNNTIVTGYTLNSEDTYTINWPADKYGVAYWPLNLDAKDVGGNYDGTANSITYRTGKFNQAAYLDGSSTSVYVGFGSGGIQATSAVDNSFSISWWMNSTDTGVNVLMNTYGSGSGAYGFTLEMGAYSAPGVITLYTYYAGSIVTTGTTAINDGGWHNIVVVKDAGSTFKLYIDGVQEVSQSISSGTQVGNELVFGNYINPYAGYEYIGLIEQARTYASVLTLSDITDIYNNSKPESLPPLKTSSDLTTTICNFPSGVTGTALYQFEGTADDSCTVGPYNGIFTNPSYGIGKFGECAEFNGSTSKIDLPDNILPDNSTANSSASVWFKSTGTLSAQGCILDAWNYDTSEPGWSLFIDQAWSSYPNGQLGLSQYYLNGSTASSLYGNHDFSDGLWHHAAVVWDNSANTLTLFVDGVQYLQWTGLTASNTWIFTQKSAIGYQNANPASPRYFNGEIDQLRIYNVALTNQQIYDLWQKENDIQTHFSSTDPADTTPANTDILVFKEGSGTISFQNDSPPGAEVGMLRYNSTLNKMEHFNSGGWKDFSYCTTDLCDYPTQANSVLLYRFNDDVTDTCGNYNGTDGGGISYDTGKFGKAINTTSGITAYVDTGYTLPAVSTISVSCWIKMTSNPGADVYVMSDMNSSADDRRLDIRIAGGSSNKLFIDNGNGPSSDNQEDTGWSPTQDVWYNIVITFNGTAGILYVDGVSTYSYTSSIAVGTAGSQSEIIGRAGHYPCCNFPGLIDQFRFFTSTLTPDKVLDLYNEVQC